MTSLNFQWDGELEPFAEVGLSELGWCNLSLVLLVTRVP